MKFLNSKFKVGDHLLFSVAIAASSWIPSSTTAAIFRSLWVIARDSSVYFDMYIYKCKTVWKDVLLGSD